MELRLLIIVMALAVLVCAVYSLYFYRQDAKQLHWFIAANIGGAIAYVMCITLTYFLALSPQLVLILGLVLAALISILTFFLYAWKGRSIREMYSIAGLGIIALIVFALMGNFLHQEAIYGPLALLCAYVGALTAVRLSVGAG